MKTTGSGNCLNALVAKRTKWLLWMGLQACMRWLKKSSWSAAQDVSTKYILPFVKADDSRTGVVEKMDAIRKDISVCVVLLLSVLKEAADHGIIDGQVFGAGNQTILRPERQIARL